MYVSTTAIVTAMQTSILFTVNIFLLQVTSLFALELNI